MGKSRKIFVLDTSVIIYDHDAIKNFGDNDVAIPITVLEELDNFKKGNDSKNFAAREFTRFVDAASGSSSLKKWLPIGESDKGLFSIVMSHPTKLDAEEIFGRDKADHKILNAALYLIEKFPKRKVIFVTKDINLRIKAKSLDMVAEDYETGKMTNEVLEEGSTPTGRAFIEGVDIAIIDKLYEEKIVSAEGVIPPSKQNNHFYILKNGKKSVLTYYSCAEKTFERVEKMSAYGIGPRNSEQAFALHAILNPKIKLVTIQGAAGTGKTLLSLAGALQQRRDFHQIYLARPIVPLSNKDIGYLPGDIKSKLNPYMEPLWDNLKLIKSQFNQQDKEYKAIEEMVANEKMVVTPLAYIRGRSLSNIFFIVDEAQNLTPHEVKTIISRAGENTKIVFTGDVYQIDTPYLDHLSNGLSYLIDKVKGHPLYAHIALERGERSELANLANDYL